MSTQGKSGSTGKRTGKVSSPRKRGTDPGSTSKRAAQISTEDKHSADTAITSRPSTQIGVMGRHSVETVSTRKYSGKNSPARKLSTETSAKRTRGAEASVTRKRTGETSATRTRSGETSSKSKLNGETSSTRKGSSEISATRKRAVETSSTRSRSGETSSTSKRSGETGLTRRRTGETTSTRKVSSEISPTRKRTVETRSTRRRSGESGSTSKRSGETDLTIRRVGETTSTHKDSSKISPTRKLAVENSSTRRRSGETSSASKHSGETGATRRHTGKTTSTRRDSSEISSTRKRADKTSSTRTCSEETSSTTKRSGDTSSKSKRSGKNSSTGQFAGEALSTRKDPDEPSSTGKPTSTTGPTRRRKGQSSSKSKGSSQTSSTNKHAEKNSSASSSSEKTSSKRKRRRSQKTNATGVHPLETGLNSLGLHVLVVAYKMARIAVRGLANSPFVLTMPLMLLLASSLTDYLVLLNATNASALLFFTAMPVPVEDARRVDAESIKKSVQAVLYLITLGLCLVHWRAVKNYVLKWPHLSVLIAILLFSTTYSLEPTKVLTNSILILVSILMPLLFVIGQQNGRGRLQSFYLLIFFPFFISHLASLFLLFSYGSDPFTVIFSTNRYGGFSGNPNSLGNTGALGLWAACALVLSSGVARHWRLVAMFSMPLFILSVAMSGSGTALVTSVLIVGLMFWMRVLAAIKPKVRLVVNVFTALVFTFLILSILLMVTPAELFVVFTGSLGKDASMTGRTDLWDIAKDAIAQRPYFGWSFDSHASVMAVREYDVRFNHYHNGFLDTVIEGGMVLMCAVLYNFGWYLARFLKLFRQNNHVYPLVVPFIVIIVLNMSEYSLLRPLSEVWQLYIACFVIMSYQYIDANVPRKPTTKNNSSTRKGWRKRKRQVIKWA